MNDEGKAGFAREGGYLVKSGSVDNLANWRKCIRRWIKETFVFDPKFGQNGDAINTFVLFATRSGFDPNKVS
jgi:hypothetical protein